MEFKLIPSGSGPCGPGQFRMIIKKPQAASCKLQAPSRKLQALDRFWFRDYKGFRK
jgi:hypothetical protein